MMAAMAAPMRPATPQEAERASAADDCVGLGAGEVLPVPEVEGLEVLQYDEYKFLR